MTIKGKITQVLPEQGGVSAKGNLWRKQEYILETQDPHPRKIAFAVMGDKIDEFAIQFGAVLVVEVDIESREFNGKWYTSVMAWKVDKIA